MNSKLLGSLVILVLVCGLVGHSVPAFAKTYKKSDQLAPGNSAEDKKKAVENAKAKAQAELDKATQKLSKSSGKQIDEKKQAALEAAKAAQMKELEKALNATKTAIKNKSAKEDNDMAKKAREDAKALNEKLRAAAEQAKKTKKQ